MTPTAYIVIPINHNPDEDGWYYVMNPNREILSRMDQFRAGKWTSYPYGVNISFWLKPVDLSKMLEDCWNSAVASTKENSMIVSGKWDQYDIEYSKYDITNDGDKYLQSILNPPK